MTNLRGRCGYPYLIDEVDEARVVVAYANAPEVVSGQGVEAS